MQPKDLANFVKINTCSKPSCEGRNLRQNLVLGFFLMVASNFKYDVGFPSPLICQSILMSGKYRLLFRYTTFSTIR